MSAILESALDKRRKAEADAADAIQRAALPGPKTWHGPNGGECPNTLDTLPVFLKYELTDDFRGNDIAEVTGVLIAGHVISATDFANDIRAAWGAQCMAARAAVGVL